MNNKQPKVLIVNGDPFNSHTATGITMTNLFRGWDKDRISQVYMFDVEPETEICQRYFRLTRSKLPVVTWLGGHKKTAGHIAMSGNPEVRSTQRNNLSLRRIKDSLGKAAEAWADVIPFRLDDKFRAWVEEFQPDIIYTQLVNIRLMNLTLYIAKWLSIPIVPHFMDDWPSTRYSNNTISIWPHHIMRSKITAILKRSPVGMTISDCMAKEYEQRYGGRFEAFMNCVEVPSGPAIINISASNAPIVFSYVGGLHLNRWRSLQQVGKALLRLKKEGLDVRAEVYAPSVDIARYGRDIELDSVMQVKGTLKSDQVMSVLQSSDVLIHIESFDTDDRQYTRLSLSTKIPQYMASGRPIFAYGPGDVASCRYIEEQGCGLVVGSRDEELMSRILGSLAKDAELRDRLGRRGRAVAEEKHNSVVERDRFRKILETVVAHGKE